MQEKVAMAFRVDPDYLRDRTYIPEGITIVSTGHYPLKFMGLNILGGSGLDMWFRGFPFVFVPKMANMLIKKGFARIYNEKNTPAFV
jgi:hypothetical protein